jgi:dihydroorotase-like cyclic amidohydrolase
LVRNDRIAKVGQNLEVPEDTEILEADGNLPIEIEAIFELYE